MEAPFSDCDIMTLDKEVCLRDIATVDLEIFRTVVKIFSWSV